MCEGARVPSIAALPEVQCIHLEQLSLTLPTSFDVVDTYPTPLGLYACPICHWFLFAFSANSAGYEISPFHMTLVPRLDVMLPQLLNIPATPEASFVL